MGFLNTESAAFEAGNGISLFTFYIYHVVNGCADDPLCYSEYTSLWWLGCAWFEEILAFRAG